MRHYRIAAFAAGVALAAGVTVAIAGTPFGGDDLGTIPSDAPKGPVTKCETGVAKAAGKLVGAVVKCHASRASGKLADDTAEDTCETAAVTKFAATKTAGCAACTGGMTGLTALGNAIVANLDTNNNKVACTATGTPLTSILVFPFRYHPSEPVENSRAVAVSGTSPILTASGLA